MKCWWKNKFFIFTVLIIAFAGVMSFFDENSGENTIEKPVSITANDSTYILHKNIMATLFWVGELADNSNGFIANLDSYWDGDWEEHFGGLDDPKNRCGFLPCSFTPKENPFYIALPYGEYDRYGKKKENIKQIHWQNDSLFADEPLKNHWVEIIFNKKTCYGQWEDVGPFETDDVDYVFGSRKPKNTEGVSAGIDISPAVWKCLELNQNSRVDWSFVDEEEVPEGPWTNTITKSGTTY